MSNIERIKLERKPTDKWTIAEVGMWLEFIEMGEYKIPFIEQQISGQDLVELTEADLMELGIRALGQRKRLQRKIADLRFSTAQEDYGGHSASGDIEADRESLDSQSEGSVRSGVSSSAASQKSQTEEKIKCKCYYKKDIRVISIKKSTTFQKLSNTIRGEYNRTLQIFWEDEDGDLIRIVTDRQLKNAVTLSTGILKLKLERKRSGDRKGSSTVSKKGGRSIKSKENDNQLEENEMAMLESLVDGCVVISADGYVEFFNKAAEKIFGYRKDEVVGKNVKMLMSPMYAARHDTYIQNYHRTRVAHVIGTHRTVLGRHKDGHNLALELSVSECKAGARHTFTGMLKQARSETDSTEDQFNLTLLNGLLEPVICIDAKGKMLHVNSKALEFFGYPPSEVIGSNISMMMPNPHRNNHDYYLAQYTKSGNSTVIGKTRDTVCELADGSVRPIRLSVTENILANGEKRFIGTITEREHDNRSRVVSKLIQQRQVIDTLATPAIIIGENGIIQAFNNSASKILGYGLDEVLGQNVSMIVGKEHAVKHDSYLQNYLRTGITKVIGKDRELNARTKSGAEIKILLTVTEHKAEDGSKFFTGMFFNQSQGIKR